MQKKSISCGGLEPSRSNDNQIYGGSCWPQGEKEKNRRMCQKNGHMSFTKK